MYRFAQCLCGCVLALSLLGISAAASAASTNPTLFSIASPGGTASADGIHKSWPITFDETKAMDAVFQGGMWLPNPNGGRIFAKYVRHILHANGTWTWIGTVSTVHGDQSVTLTFGKGVMFGSVPQASGWPLEISTAHGHTRIVATSAEALARSTAWLRMHSQPNDAVIPPRLAHAHARAHAAAVHPATAASPATIDIMVAYTPGFITVYGGADAALTRIQYLVDVTNQAYVDSQVYQQLNLVNTVEVNYPDNNSDGDALTDLSNAGDGTGSYPASLQTIAALRRRYAADLVTLVRPFDAATESANQCGIGYLDGANGATPTAAFGFSVVSDKSDSTVTNGMYCAINTFAHELGHNMGDAHDRANASSQGAYPYSYGYIGTNTAGANIFGTIMSYDLSQITMVFSNPNVSTCQNHPCGVADDSATSADNAHSMNNTAPIVAAFEARQARNDVNGDAKSDILFTNPATGQLVYWLMNGNHYAGYAAFLAGPQYRVIGTGDFNGDRKVDIVWTDGSSVWLWLSNGHGGYSGVNVGSAPSVYYPASDWTMMGSGEIFSGQSAMYWYSASLHELQVTTVSGTSAMGYYSMCQLPAGVTPVGVGDLTGSGLADAVFEDASYHAYVLRGGDYSGCYDGGADAIVASNGVSGPGYVPAGISDVDGDGRDDVVWVNPSTGTIVYWLMNGSSFTGYGILSAGPGYSVESVADFDGDGMADVLWAKGSNLYMWLHGNTGKYYGTTVQPYAAGWNILP